MSQHSKFCELLVSNPHYYDSLAAVAQDWGHVKVRRDDSIAAGNCKQGTRRYARELFPGRRVVTIKEMHEAQQASGGLWPDDSWFPIKAAVWAVAGHLLTEEAKKGGA